MIKKYPEIALERFDKAGLWIKYVVIKVKRFFYIYGKKGQVRGNHAHKKCTQIFIPIFGTIKLNLIDGYKKKFFYLNHKKNYGVVVPPKIWINLYFLNKNSIVLVICDRKYEYKDYIGTYTKYLNFIKKNESISHRRPGSYWFLFIRKY